MPQFRLLLALAASCALALPTAANAQGSTQPAGPPVAYASVNELNNILGQLKQTSQNIQIDLQKARVEKWKTDGSTKKQTQGNVESIQRNLQSALPELMTQVNNAPEDLAATFKLYRNMDALYDVFRSVVESAGAFGSKDDFQSLSNDITALESVRRSIGERVQNLANSKETELTRLRAQVKTLQAGPPAPPKKVVVDDTEPPKKPVKKKPAKPAPAASKPSATPTNPPNSPAK
jgi:hypothetical protein